MFIFSEGEGERLGFFYYVMKIMSYEWAFFLEEFQGTCNKVCPKEQNAIAHREISPDNIFVLGCDFSGRFK